MVHPTYKNKTGTLLDILLADPDRWPADARPSIVGRLDKLTSGIVVVAKTAAMHAALQRAWASRDAEKDYLAVVYGRVSEPSGTIDLRLRHDPVDRRMMVVSNEGEAPPLLENDGMSSVTRFERLAAVDARAGRAVAPALPSGHRPPASDPRAPRGAWLANHRRPAVRRAALVADRRRRASLRPCRRFRARHSTPWRVAFDASDHARARGNRSAGAARPRRSDGGDWLLGGPEGAAPRAIGAGTRGAGLSGPPRDHRDDDFNS